MNNYLTELSAIHLALTAGYWAILRKEIQYAAMRFYLIGSVVLALIVPLFKLPKIFGSANPIGPTSVDVILSDGTATSPAPVSPVVVYDLLLWVYVIVSLFFLVKFLHGIIYLVRLRRKNNGVQNDGEIYIFQIPGIHESFSFFNWVFLGREIEDSAREMILKHEKGHFSLGHTYDLIFLGLFRICFWWLPTAWFIRNEIKKIHEYQADAYVLKSFSADLYSSILITSTLNMNGLNLTSPFGSSFVLQRLNAMRQKTKNISHWKHVTLAGLCVSLFIVFACSEETVRNGTGGDMARRKTEEACFVSATKQEEPLDGRDEFYKHVENEITYPPAALRMQVEGNVEVGFVVEKDGSISDVKVVKGIGTDCDKEAVRVVQNAPPFRAASRSGYVW